MSVSTTNTKTFQTGDGATTQFPFTFQMPASFTPSELQVWITPVDPTTHLATGPATKLNTTAYSYYVNPNNVGGVITFAAAPALSTLPNICIARVLQMTQGTALITEGSLPEATLVAMVDRTVMLCQQVQEQLNRALTLGIASNYSGSLQLPDPSALALIGWDATPANPVNYSQNGIVLPTPVAPLSSGAVGSVFTGNGVGVPGSFQPPAGIGTVNGLFRPQNIVASIRALPTIGALSGTYIHFGNWTQTGNITFAHGTRIYINGNFTTLATKTFTGVPQGNGGVCAGSAENGGNGGGEGGGAGGATIAAGGQGGSGGAGAGAGGIGGCAIAFKGFPGGVPVVDYGTGGSGGGAGGGSQNALSTGIGGAGGGGGPAILIECVGAVTLNESLNSDGQAGATSAGVQGGSGGGGGGGQIIIRCTGNFLLAAAKLLTANGGAGGALNGTKGQGGGGGGGFIEITAGGTVVTTGTVQVNGGAAGTGAAQLTIATAGSNGTFTSYAGVSPVSL